MRAAAHARLPLAEQSGARASDAPPRKTPTRLHSAYTPRVTSVCPGRRLLWMSCVNAFPPVMIANLRSSSPATTMPSPSVRTPPPDGAPCDDAAAEAAGEGAAIVSYEGGAGTDAVQLDVITEPSRALRCFNPAGCAAVIACDVARLLPCGPAPTRALTAGNANHSTNSSNVAIVMATQYSRLSSRAADRRDAARRRSIVSLAYPRAGEAEGRRDARRPRAQLNDSVSALNSAASANSDAWKNSRMGANVRASLASVSVMREQRTRAISANWVPPPADGPAPRVASGSCVSGDALFLQFAPPPASRERRASLARRRRSRLRTVPEREVVGAQQQPAGMLPSAARQLRRQAAALRCDGLLARRSWLSATPGLEQSFSRRKLVPYTDQQARRRRRSRRARTCRLSPRPCDRRRLALAAADIRRRVGRRSLQRVPAILHVRRHDTMRRDTTPAGHLLATAGRPRARCTAG